MTVFRVSKPQVCGSWCAGYDHDLLCGDHDDQVEVVGGAFDPDTGRALRAVVAGQERSLVMSVSALDVWEAGRDATVEELRRVVADALSRASGIALRDVCMTNFAASGIPVPEVFLNSEDITRSVHYACR